MSADAMGGPAVLALAFVLGACIGSFLNVCISRWPAEESVVAPRSRCPKCGRPIAALENIPIVSWLLLRGRCRGCALPISPMYPLIELAVALGWVAAVAAYGPTFTALRVAVLGTVLLGIAITDLRHYLIPDGFTVFGLVWVLATSVISAFLLESTPFAEPYDAILGACVGAGAISIAGWLGEVVLKKEAMGFGDVTLMAVVGAAVGPTRSLLVIFVGALIGALGFLLVVYPIARIRHARARAHPASGTVVAGPGEGGAPGTDEDVEMPQVPFGVFLAPAALVTLLWGRRLIDLYFGYVTAP